MVATDVGDAFVKTGNFRLLFFPIFAKFRHALERSLKFGELRKILPQCVGGHIGRSVVREHGSDRHADVKSDLDALLGVDRGLNFALREDGNVPAVRFSHNGEASDRAFDQAAPVITAPTDARQTNLLSRPVDLEALRKPNGILILEFLVKFREVRAALPKRQERAMQVLHRLLENLAVALGEPRRLFLPFGQKGAEFRIAQFEARILLVHLLVPSQTLVVDIASATAKPCQLADRRPVGLELENKGFMK